MQLIQQTQRAQQTAHPGAGSGVVRAAGVGAGGSVHRARAMPVPGRPDRLPPLQSIIRTNVQRIMHVAAGPKQRPIERLSPQPRWKVAGANAPFCTAAGHE